MQKERWEVLPKQFLDRLAEIIPNRNFVSVLTSFCTKKPTSFRTNLLKTTTGTLYDALTKQGFSLQTVPWYNDALLLKDRKQKELTTLDLYTNGYFYVQSLSSMIPALIVDPKPDERVCDLTAAPGSKTTQMAMMMKNKGEIFANDISRFRLYKLEANLRIQGVTNTKILKMPGQLLWEHFPEYFDKTLVDVPCTLEGRFFCDSPKTFRDWTPRKSKVLSWLQRLLLRSAVSATKTGGSIVYSTCTLEPEENEAVIDWILKKEHGALIVEKITVPRLDMHHGISQWRSKQFTSQVQQTIRILPSETMEGFFVAKLRKIASTISKPLGDSH